jgi:nitrate/nitrite transporter NarK
LSTAIGAPLGGLLLRLDGVAGLHGWQWLFIAEGLPSVALGIMLLWLLPDRPANATWLTPAESASLTATLDAENAAVASRNPISVRKTLGHPRVLALALVYFTVAFGVYGLGFWMPQIIKTSLGISDNLTVTLLTAIPYAAGAIAMVSWGRWCDRRGHAAMFTVLPMAAGGVALASSALVTSSPWLGYLGLCVCAACVMAAFPAFWTLPTSFLTGAAVAAGIGIVNSIGNLAGFVGPYWVGWTTSAFGSPRWGLVTIGCVMVAGAVLVGVLRTSADVPDSRAVPNTGPVPASSL